MKTSNIEYIKGDCIEVMSRYPDNYFDVAIVDPPYGINITKSNRLATSRGMGGKNWDSEIPDGKYFDELFRVSKHQVIWGWNYFVQYLSACKCYLKVWHAHLECDLWGWMEAKFIPHRNPKNFIAGLSQFLREGLAGLRYSLG